MINRLHASGVLVVAVTVVSLLPGFSLPFVLSLRFAASESDSILLSYNTLALITSIVGFPVEANSLAECARRNARIETRGMFARYFIRVTCIVATLSATVALIAGIAYGTRTNIATYLIEAAPYAVAGFLTGISSIFAGALIARSLYIYSIATQGCRALPAVIACLTSNVKPEHVGYLILAGEAIRFILLAYRAVASSPSPRSATDHLPDWESNGISWQSVSTAGSQASPIIDRWFLSASYSGAITAYEIADKVYYSGYQLISSGLLLRRVSAWGDISGAEYTEARAVLNRDVVQLGATAGALVPLAFIAAWLSMRFNIVPDQWNEGLIWSAAAAAGLPFGIIQLISVRLIIALRRQSILLRMTALSVTSNFVLDVLLFHSIGALGIVISSLGTRILVGCFYYATAIRVLQTNAITVP